MSAIWQSIDTAPKDGTLIVGVDRNAADVGWMLPYVMRWDRMRWQYNDGREWKNWPGDPLFWTELPDAMPDATRGHPG